MIQELEMVALAADIPEHGLRSEDVGTVVLAHGKAGCEVEFLTLTGETLAVVSLSMGKIRAINRREIAHARPLGRTA